MMEKNKLRLGGDDCATDVTPPRTDIHNAWALSTLLRWSVCVCVCVRTIPLTLVGTLRKGFSASSVASRLVSVKMMVRP
jgi:hypothetical protein